MCDLKVTQMNVKRLIWELMPYEVELDHNTIEVTKNTCWKKEKRSLSWLQKLKGWRNFAWVARTSMIRQGLIGLKVWIPLICSNTQSINKALSFTNYHELPNCVIYYQNIAKLLTLEFEILQNLMKWCLYIGGGVDPKKKILSINLP